MKGRAGYISADDAGMQKSGEKSAVSRPSVPSRLSARSFSLVKVIPSVVMLFALMVPAVLSLVSSGDGTGNGVSGSHRAQAASVSQDFPQWFMCEMAPGLATEPLEATRPELHLLFQESPRLYQWATTDDIPFYLQSKSAITGTHDKVDDYLPNKLVNMTTGPSFGEVNDWVVGTVDPNADEREDYEEFSSSTAVSPYDRFGFAGLNWSSYGGEWKYYKVDACNPGDEGEDPGLNKFYEDRLEPRATFEGTENSLDPRTQQFNIGWFAKVGYGIGNTVANHVFFVAKFVVALTVSLVSFAFGDVVSMLGIDTVLLGEDGEGSGGVFNMLFQGIFLPLIVLAFILTACYMLYYGIIKRQYRTALVSGLLRSVVCFFAAFVILMNPAWFINFPNAFAVGAQSLVLSGVSEGSAGGDGLCATSIHEAEEIQSASDEGGDIEDDYDFMESVGASISSTLGCTMWNTLLLDPWAEGQFGAGIDELYAEGHTEDGQGSIGNDSSSGNNDDNGSWVGDADVPLGNDETMNNWAVFQLSTQTGSHYDVENEELSEKYTAGVNNDWWRVVDALSNYNERQFTNDLTDVGSTTGDSSVEFPDSVISDVDLDTAEGTEVSPTDTTPYWNSWIGNNSGERFLMAFSSVVFSIGSTIPLMILAFLNIVYAIGLTIIIAFAPFFLLLACWAGKGWSIFLDWAQLLLNTMLSRIALGVLMVIVIAITNAGMDLLDELGFFKAFVALVLMLWLVMKNRKKLMDQIAFVRFSSAGGGLSDVASKIGGGSSAVAKIASGAAIAGTVGGIHGARRGDVLTGARTGASTSFKNSMYRYTRHSPMISRAQMAYNAESYGIDGGHRAVAGGIADTVRCARCGADIDESQRFVQSLSTSLVYCLDCYDARDFIKNDDINTVREIEPTERTEILSEKKKTSGTRDQVARGPRIRKRKAARAPAAAREDIAKHRELGGSSDVEAHRVASLVNDKQLDLDMDSEQDRDFVVAVYGIEESLEDLAGSMLEESDAVQAVGDENLDRHSLSIPEMPEEIHDKIDYQVIHELIAAGEWEALAEIIADAWVEWYEEQGVKSTLHRDELGYDEDRVSDLRIESFDRLSQFSETVHTISSQYQDDDEQFPDEDYEDADDMGDDASYAGTADTGDNAVGNTGADDADSETVDTEETHGEDDAEDDDDADRR